MNLNSVQQKLEAANLFHSQTTFIGQPSVVGYEKKFRWAWMATQLNTFMVATEVGEQEITPALIEAQLAEAFEFTKSNYTGWPRGLQSALGVIGVLIGSQVSPEAITYCEQLKSGKKWAGFTIPVVYDTSQEALYYFDKNPYWGRIYYPHFRELIMLLK